MLYVVSTPIGNMGDISLRALETLRNADLIACEDTRHTLGLLTHYGIKKPLISYYEQNKMSRGAELLERLKNGEEIALVSDAGTPGISDPGHELIRDASEAGIKVTMIPGCVAGVTALVLSGFPTDKFTFMGFIGTENRERKEFYRNLGETKYTAIVYEAPHRLLRTLSELKESFDEADTRERRIAVCRELTKAHEEIRKGTASELLEYYTENQPRGEIVLIIEGAPEKKCEIPDDGTIAGMVQKLINGGLKPREAMRRVGENINLPKNYIYDACEREKSR